MKLFRSRGRHDAPAAAGSPLDQPVGLYKAGRYVAAESAARAVAESRSTLRDDQVALVAWSLVGLATSAQGRHAEAVAVYDRLLPDFGRVFGAEAVLTLKLRSDRAQELARLGRYAECEAECAAVARIAERGGSEETGFAAAAARNGLAFALTEQGRHEEAEATAREALAALGAQQDRFTVTLLAVLARSLNGQARHEEALAAAERADALWQALPEGERHAESGAAGLARATALLGLGRTAEARTHAAAAHRARLAAHGPEHRGTADAQALLDRIGSA
ncbi:tetratricopeptide repeat protein [Actinacidiphila bryophytorum]|uniref:Tetratricopeptide repeat protein n=1 Tax=Actinacidiphila bryophytorum TaxID=1436133 RepID=A0A9W4H3U2_9ACTN|nr:tetratricopeptide repeat protein [Actinacidiphila bryophytorum]MBM9439871.1 tetratricopeptide repeat protein [Actinacidiphila bryophytorum]MBN6542789.1 tetratricopeptide repeat protein [Actinacidiphila bryophytorum]CAG7648305.1 conserved hypothetical protein [Actinacidiphila bryophytorum]